MGLRLSICGENMLLPQITGVNSQELEKFVNYMQIWRDKTDGSAQWYTVGGNAQGNVELFSFLPISADPETSSERSPNEQAQLHHKHAIEIQLLDSGFQLVFRVSAPVVDNNREIDAEDHSLYTQVISESRAQLFTTFSWAAKYVFVNFADSVRLAQGKNPLMWFFMGKPVPDDLCVELVPGGKENPLNAHIFVKEEPQIGMYCMGSSAKTCAQYINLSYEKLHYFLENAQVPSLAEIIHTHQPPVMP